MPPREPAYGQPAYGPTSGPTSGPTHGYANAPAYGQPYGPPPPAAPAPTRRPRRLFLATVLLAVAVVAVGVVTIVRGWLATSGPDGAVRGYFRALAAEDAATALGYGTVPEGNRSLLTDKVLQEQQRIAPIEDVAVAVEQQTGDRARVRVQYTLAFASDEREIDTVLGLHQDDGDWRLDRSAVATQLVMQQAAQRVTVLGSALPSGAVVVFPGAAPITLDTPYLQLEPADGAIALDAAATTTLEVEVTTSARNDMLAVLRRALLQCLTKQASPRCPLPSERTVPGSVQGTLAGTLAKDVDISVNPSPAGLLSITGDVSVRGSYRELKFDNTVTARTGASFTLPVDTRAYAMSPLTVGWYSP